MTDLKCPICNSHIDVANTDLKVTQIGVCENCIFPLVITNAKGEYEVEAMSEAMFNVLIVGKANDARKFKLLISSKLKTNNIVVNDDTKWYSLKFLEWNLLDKSYIEDDLTYKVSVFEYSGTQKEVEYAINKISNGD